MGHPIIIIEDSDHDFVEDLSSFFRDPLERYSPDLPFSLFDLIGSIYLEKRLVRLLDAITYMRRCAIGSPNFGLASTHYVPHSGAAKLTELDKSYDQCQFFLRVLESLHGKTPPQFLLSLVRETIEAAHEVIGYTWTENSIISFPCEVGVYSLTSQVAHEGQAGVETHIDNLFPDSQTSRRLHYLPANPTKQSLVHTSTTCLRC